MAFIVEGRTFGYELHAFTFAQIQADRMKRPVIMECKDLPDYFRATAYPTNFKRKHLIKSDSL